MSIKANLVDSQLDQGPLQEETRAISHGAGITRATVMASSIFTPLLELSLVQ